VVGGLWGGWVKLNVVFLCRQVCRQNTSFNFAEAVAFPFFLLSVNEYTVVFLQ
jgi:hypothetical protein